MAQTDTATEVRGTQLTDSPMMKRLLDALEAGQDIGHYGRLTFVMVAQYFMDDDQIVELLTKSPDTNEDEARALVAEVKAHGYNPPRGDTVRKWQKMQDFQICESDDPNACNVYEELRFPDKVYDRIGDYWEDRVEAEES